MATPRLQKRNVDVRWHSLVVDAEVADGGWNAVKARYEDRYEMPITGLLSPNSVYVIRLMRPWSVVYRNEVGRKERHSPCLYVGRGNFKQRFTSHLKHRIAYMAQHFQGAQWEVRFFPFLSRTDAADISRALEAELLEEFRACYGSLPLLNKRSETIREDYSFTKSTTKVLHPGAGGGFHYGIWPLRSSPFYSASQRF